MRKSERNKILANNYFGEGYDEDRIRSLKGSRKYIQGELSKFAEKSKVLLTIEGQEDKLDKLHQKLVSSLTQLKRITQEYSSIECDEVAVAFVNGEYHRQETIVLELRREIERYKAKHPGLERPLPFPEIEQQRISQPFYQQKEARSVAESVASSSTTYNKAEKARIKLQHLQTKNDQKLRLLLKEKEVEIELMKQAAFNEITEAENELRQAEEEVYGHDQTNLPRQTYGKSVRSDYEFESPKYADEDRKHRKLESYQNQRREIVQKNSNEPVDSFIDQLVEGVETFIAKDNNLTVSEVLRHEYESKNLPTIELPTFDGDSSRWPEFILSFRNRIHFKSTFTDSDRLERLISILKGEARKSVQSIGTSGIFYATVLKSLKRDFGDPAVIAHSKIKNLLDRPQIRLSDRNGLRQIQQHLKCTILWLENMGLYGTLNSLDVTSSAFMKLPNELRKSFYKRAKGKSEISLVFFESWLADHISEIFNPIADIIASKETELKSNKPNQPIRKHNFQLTTNHSEESENPVTCWVCSKGHKIYNCPNFKAQNLEEKRGTVKRLKLCYNCLSNNHLIKSCQSSRSCNVPGCAKRHHTLLHDPLREPTTASSTEPIQSVRSSFGKTSRNDRCFLQILPVTIKVGPKVIHTNAMLDDGSDASFIRDDVARFLGLEGQSRNLKVKNILSNEEKMTSTKVKVGISSKSHPSPISINCWTTQNLNLPKQSISENDIQTRWPHLQGIDLQLNDGDVTILIGANSSHLHLQYDCKLGRSGDPIAVKTKLGWVLMGGSEDDSDEVNSNRISTQQLNDNLAQFWSIESYGTVPENDPSTFSVNEKQSLQILQTSTKNINDQFEISLLWKDEAPTLPYNRDSAVKRLVSLEKRLQRDKSFSDQYHATMNDYITQGHATKLTSQERLQKSSITNYIPHHGVIHPNKPGKVRVVFDAASKTDGKSLNESLLPGINFLNNLVSVLQRFRKGRFAVMSDIKKMFHQVKVTPKDSDALRFVWRDSPSDPIEDFKMTVHLFGKVDSPCIANWALRQCGTDQKPHVRDAIEKNFYMDDYLNSSTTSQVAIETAKQVSNALQKGHFHLTKWISNSAEVLKALPSEELSPATSIVDLNQLPTERALGILWDTKSDCFTFRISQRSVPDTKRGILSLTSSFFDPLGMLTPCLLEPKLILQQLWKERYDWNQQLPPSIIQRWNVWRNDMSNLQAVRIPRWFGFHADDVTNIQLHVFVDASSQAYGAVSFLRVQTNSEIKMIFLLGKSRVAPLKELTIPKLELQAAVIGSRMKRTVINDLELQITQCYMWTDSEIVLKYLRNTDKRFSIFVTNRLNEIREHTSVREWNYIPTELNVADHCTRAMEIRNLPSKPMWFFGPDFLYRSIEDWPCFETTSTNTTTTDVDETPTDVHSMSANATSKKVIKSIINWSRYSTWTKLVRAITWILKFKNRWLASRRKHKHPSPINVLTADELYNAELKVCRLSQEESFTEEMEALSRDSVVAQRSSISSLRPIIKSGIMRIGGRINAIKLPFESRHQLILHSKHPISNLVLRHYHERTFHSGREATLSESRTRFWVVHGKSLVRRIVQDCFFCKKRRALTSPPMMADLPLSRLAHNEPPFTFTGVDYFGPMYVKQGRKTRLTTATAKRYGALYTCMTTRAVHLELAGDLSSDCFILSLRRFISRRGRPRQIRSDNGTNFVGAQRELANALKQLNQSKIHKELAEKGIDWQFSTPGTPWTNGAIESMVKVTKTTLKAIVQDRLFTEEALITFLTEVESIVNGRPLTALSDDINDYEPLTPNHLLIGKNSENVEIVDSAQNSLRSKWRAVQAATTMFWNRWLKEYLPMLNHRKKWLRNNRNFRIGDMVLIVNKNIPRGKWPLGRIAKVYGNDDIVRTVDVKTNLGVYQRSTHDLALLETVT